MDALLIVLNHYTKNNKNERSNVYGRGRNTGTYRQGKIVPPPNLNGIGTKYISGIGKAGNEVKLILNCEKLMAEDEAKTLDYIKQ